MGNILFDGLNVITLRYENSRKRAGLDILPNVMLKECTVALCEPLLFVFNRTLKLGDERQQVNRE